MNHREEQQTFGQTELGAAFLAFERACADSWRKNTDFDHTDSERDHRRAIVASKKMDAARRDLMAILLPLAERREP